MPAASEVRASEAAGAGPTGVRAPDAPVIRARGVTKKFGKVVAVDGLDLSIGRGDVYGFLGPNGSGKSTTIRMLCGLLLPSGGEIEVLGLAIPRQAEALRRRIGYMTQKFSLYDDLTVGENLRFVARIHGLTRQEIGHRCAQLIESYHLGELRDRLAGAMSGGQRQRLALAASVLHRPELLFLDEPTSAVDPQSRRDFWDALFALAAAGTTLLVSTHYMDEAERCHRLAILDRGRLVADGTPAALMQALPGATLLVESEAPRRAQAVLAGSPLIRLTAQVGASLRVLTNVAPASPDEDAVAGVESLLRAAGIESRVQRTAPNLEDVFVEATRGAATSELRP